MSVLKGEGKVPILFGTKSVTAGAHTLETYLARPNLSGEWPTVVVVPSAWGITSSMKDLARRIARRAVAAVVVDVYRGSPPDRGMSREEAQAAHDAVPRDRALRDVIDVVRFVENPAGFWSNAEDGVAVVGIGGGGGLVGIRAAHETGATLIMTGSPLPVEVLSRITAPILGLYGRDDDVVSVEAVMAARSAAPHAEWVLYDGVGHDFLDDHSPDYDDAAHHDAVERITGFCEKHLPPQR